MSYAGKLPNQTHTSINHVRFMISWYKRRVGLDPVYTGEETDLQFFPA